MQGKLSILFVAFLTFFSVLTPAFSEEAVKEKPTEEGSVITPDSGQFIKLHPIMIPIIQNRHLIGAYVIDLVLEATSVENADDLRKIQPTIRDALLTDIFGVFSLIWDGQTRIHLPDFKARLVKVAEKAGGKSRVKDVLIQGFQRQISKRHIGYDYRK